MRKKIKVNILLIIIFLSQIAISGCWDYIEIEDRLIVVGLAIDKCKETSKYIVTVETVSPKGTGEIDIESDLISMKGETIFDAIRNVILYSGKKMYWSHEKVLIISEEIAKEGIIPALDLITRDSETRADILLLVSKEETAREILEGVDKVHSTISFHLEDMLKAQEHISKYKTSKLWLLLDELASEGISATVPTVEMMFKQEEIIPKVYGIAVFKRDKMVGWLDGIETRSFLIIRDEIKEPVIVVKEVGDTEIDVTVEVYTNKVKVKPELKDEEIIMKIIVEMEVGIGEIVGSEDFISKGGREKLEKASEELIKSQMEHVIKKVQREYESDIFGFGSIVRREMPNVWKKVKSYWNEIFVDLKTEISVDVTVKGSGLTSKPIGVSD